MRQRTFMPQQLAEIAVVDPRAAYLARVAVVCRQLAFHSGTTRRTDLAD
jgi:hypothetical protein